MVKKIKKGKAKTKKPVKVKGVDISFLTKRQQTAMKKHSVHHTKKHMQEMATAMKKGATFEGSHTKAMKKTGR